MRKEAQQLAKQKVIVQNKHNCQPKFESNKFQFDSDYIGFLGQIVYRKYLRTTNQEYTERVIINGKGDNGYDFKVNGELIDVKSSQMRYQFKDTKWDKKWFFLLNRWQVEDSHADYFVSVQISMHQKFGYMMGHITPNEVIANGLMKSSQYSHNYNVLFSWLTERIE